MTVTIYKGSILDCDVDAIVNPANSFMRHDGGLARVIDQAARKRPKGYWLRQDGSDGPSAWRYQEQESAVDRYELDCLKAPLIPTGGAYPTSAGVLPFEAIIHAVGPIWGGGILCEHKLLSLAYRNALYIAENLELNSIAFPAISAGIFGVPIAIVAAAASHAVIGTPDVTFALMEDAHVEAFKNVFKYAKVSGS